MPLNSVLENVSFRVGLVDQLLNRNVIPNESFFWIIVRTFYFDSLLQDRKNLRETTWAERLYLQNGFGK